MMKAVHWIVLIMSVLAILVITDYYAGWSERELKAYELESQNLRDAQIRAKLCARRPVLCDTETK